MAAVRNILGMAIMDISLPFGKAFIFVFLKKMMIFLNSFIMCGILNKILFLGK